MFARFLAIKIVCGLLLFTGCATAPHAAPRYVQPTTIPIQKAIAVAQAHITAAQAKVVVIEKECPAAKPEIDALSTDLNGAYNELQTSEGARVQLDTQLKDMTEGYNQLADRYDKSAIQIEGLQESRHGWVKRFWLATVAAAVSAAWIFKKPLLLLAGI